MFDQHFLRLIPGIYGLIMIIVITCIFTRGFTDFQTNLIDQLISFDYLRTYIDLYFVILIDSLVFIIYSMIFSIKSVPCLLRTRLVLIIFQLIIYAYSLSKFLIFYEWINVRNETSPYQLNRFDYLAMIFISLFAIGGIFIWIVFFGIINKKSTDPERQHLINETATRRSYTEETDPLIVESKYKSYKTIFATVNSLDNRHLKLVDYLSHSNL